MYNVIDYVLRDRGASMKVNIVDDKGNCVVIGTLIPVTIPLLSYLIKRYPLSWVSY